jgi:hypothetical protein
VHLFGFIIRIYHDARSSECQTETVDCRRPNQHRQVASKSNPLTFVYDIITVNFMVLS